MVWHAKDGWMAFSCPEDCFLRPRALSLSAHLCLVHLGRKMGAGKGTEPWGAHSQEKAVAHEETVQSPV